jgi:hypothetical protein
VLQQTVVRSHEQDAMGRQLGRAALFEGASAGRVRVDEYLCVSVERSAEVVHTLCWTIFLAESSNIVCFLSVSTVRVQ